MRSQLLVLSCISPFFGLVSTFQLQRSDLLHQNTHSRSSVLSFHPNKPRPCSRTTVSAIPTDNDSEKDAVTWLEPISEDPKRSWCFSLLMATCGAMLGPFLDSYHSAFGVLEYSHPITKVLWGSSEQFAALTTAWWVPELFAVAGFLIGWLYILLDNILLEQKTRPLLKDVLIGISLFTFQYWLSGILFYSEVSRAYILAVMSLVAVVGFFALDGTMAGFLTSSATAIGGPAIEVGLLWLSSHGWDSGYHYNDTGETGYLPLWACSVYFLGGPANGNLARWLWNLLTEEDVKKTAEPCPVCKDTRRVWCPNCDGAGTYEAMGGTTVGCTSCNGRGFVICRACFDQYDEDPYDIEAIRGVVSRMPD